MRRLLASLALSLLVVAGCSSTGDDGDAGEGPSAESSRTTEEATEPTELTVETVPTTVADAPKDPAATGSILMVKLYVDDLEQGERFYGSVFGTTLTMQVGEGAHIISFPEGGPGLVLLERGDEDAEDKVGSFIVQVPDLEASLALAEANGATAEAEFEGDTGEQPARSIDVLDPWGNEVEILQIG